MAKCLFIYHDGTYPTSDAEVKRVMEQWGAWIGALGATLLDGGNPVGRSYTVASDGTLGEGGGANPTSGYSLVEAADIEDAHRKARSCPISPPAAPSRSPRRSRCGTFSPGPDAPSSRWPGRGFSA